MNLCESDRIIGLFATVHGVLIGIGGVKLIARKMSVLNRNALRGVSIVFVRTIVGKRKDWL